jgi:hypothetical protein
MPTVAQDRDSRCQARDPVLGPAEFDHREGLRQCPFVNSRSQAPAAQATEPPHRAQHTPNLTPAEVSSSIGAPRSPRQVVNYLQRRFRIRFVYALE